MRLRCGSPSQTDIRAHNINLGYYSSALPGLAHEDLRINTCICSIGMNLTRPLTTTRGASSPTSISSTYKESASGCFFTFLITPTRISSLVTSTAASFASAGSFLPLESVDEAPFLPLEVFSVTPGVDGPAHVNKSNKMISIVRICTLGDLLLFDLHSKLEW